MCTSGCVPPGCSRSCRRCDGDGIRTCRRSASIREYRPTGVDDLRVGQNQRLRTARHSALDEGLTQEESGELKVEAELGRAKAPVAERFRELLDRAVRIAKINAEANPR